MASKCWFVLRHSHYPPPVIPKNGIGSVTGVLCPGHLIPNLKHLDDVINRSGPLAIPPDMPLYSTQAQNLTWAAHQKRGPAVSGRAGLPIATAVGLTVHGDVGLAFERTTQYFWEFEALDTFIFRPTREYIEDSLETDEVAEYRKRRGPLRSSSLFMITGVMVARGAKTSMSESHKKEVHAGYNVEFQGAIGVGAGVSLPLENSTTLTGEKTSDFVWAVRLSKITRGFVDRLWQAETFSTGATFSTKEDDQWQEIVSALQAEGFQLPKTATPNLETPVFIVLEDEPAEEPATEA